MIMTLLLVSKDAKLGMNYSKNDETTYIDSRRKYR